MNQSTNHFSLLLLIHNEDDRLKANFSWLKDHPIINEVVVVDDNSTDGSAKTIKSWSNKELKVSYFSRGLENDFSSQRQFGVDKSLNDWIIWLDPDEVPNKDFLKYIDQFDFNQCVTISVKRKDIFLKHQLNHGETANQSFVRIFNRQHGKFVHPVHEVWQSSQETKSIPASINHESHLTLQSFLSKINLYSSIRAQELYSQKVAVGIFGIICYPLGKFFEDYIYKLGFLDSTPGIIMALGMSFHSFLVRAKLWQLHHP